MILIEKVQATGINTDVAPDAIEKLGGDRKIVNPILDCLNKRYFTSDNSSKYKWENIKGTIQKTITLPSGTNKCIGSYEDYIHNLLIYWLYNSTNKHTVIAYDPETDSSSFLLNGTTVGLNFQSTGLKISAGVIGDLLYWTDGLNPLRGINITRTYVIDGLFNTVAKISLLKAPPSVKPIVGETPTYSNDPAVSRTYDSSIPDEQNRIYNRNFQFAYRLRYLDDEYSVLSPYSDVSYGEYYPINSTPSIAGSDITTNHKYGNKIKVYISSGSILNLTSVKQVEVLVRENNTGNWKAWRIYNGPFTLFSVLSDYFKNTETLIDVDQSQTSKISESIPNFSNSLCTHKNRIFCIDDEEGFDVQDTPPTLSLSTSSYCALGFAQVRLPGYLFGGGILRSSSSSNSISKGSKNFTVSTPINSQAIGMRMQMTADGSNYMFGILTAIFGGGTSLTIEVDLIVGGGSYSSWNVSGVFDYYKSYWKTRGMYNIGIAIFDESMRSMGIVSKQSIQIPDAKYFNLFPFTPTRYIRDNLLNVNISGSFSGTPKAKYFSLCATEDQSRITFHQSMVEIMFYKFDAPTGYSASSSEYIYNGMVFYKTAPVFTVGGQNVFIYFRLPKEFPVVPDKTWSIHPTLIFEYFGGKYGTIVDSDIISVAGDVVKTQSNFGVFSPSGIGDYNSFIPYYTDASGRRRYCTGVEFYQKNTGPNNNLFFEITDRYSIDNAGTLSKTSFTQIQGPSYVLKTIPNNFDGFTIPMLTQDALIAGADTVASRAGVLMTQIETLTHVGILSQFQNAVATKVTANLFSILSDYQKVVWNKGIFFAELLDKKKIKRNSTIRFSNKFVQDSQINGLSSFDAGNQHTVSLDRGAIIKLVALSNNILAIHTFASTTLYTEEGLLRTADDNASLISTNDVIGHDRALQGGFGSIHPESIAQIDNMVFGWDNYQGVVWQYTNQGQEDVSQHGQKEYFRQKQLLILANINTARVIGEIDPFHQEYIITFLIDGTNDQTIAYNYIENRWVQRYSFLPEMMGRLNNNLFSFKSGALWIHNKDSVNLNRFYNVNYPALIKIAVNPHPTKVKNWLGLQLSAAVLTSSNDPDFKVIEISTPDGQYSYLTPDEFELYEKTYYANILKDVNTPAAILPTLSSTSEALPALSSWTNKMDASLLWTLGSNPYIQFIADDSITQGGTLIASVSWVANNKYTVIYDFAIEGTDTNLVEIIFQVFNAGTLLASSSNIIAYSEGNVSGEVNILMPAVNGDTLGIVVLARNSITGSTKVTVNSLSSIQIIPQPALQTGDDIKSKYLIVQVNEAVAPSKNSTQQLNVTFVPSEYSV